MPKVVITLPAYRAAATVAKTVADVPEHFAEDMILVDDASPDNTVELARDLGLRVYVHPANLGYGANLKTCYVKALEGDASVVVVLHPDNQYDPKAVPLLVAPILAGDADMTFGSRFAGVGDPRSGGMPQYRFLGNRITTVLQNALLGTRFTEMHSGLRAYTRECLLALPFLGYSDDFAFESQILVDAVVRQQRVVEVPIPTRYEDDSSSLRLSRLFKYVWESLDHTARATARWGRRGRRWPAPRANRRSAAPRASVRRWKPPGTRAAAGPPTLDPVLEALQSYLLPGNTVAVVSPSEDWLQRLTLVETWQRAADPSAKSDALVVVGASSDASDVTDAITSARSSLHDEGMLVVVIPASTRRPLVPGRLPSPPTRLLAALGEHGFRLVEWDRAGRSVGSWMTGFARPERP
jgi:hypothetical protein